MCEQPLKYTINHTYSNGYNMDIYFYMKPIHFDFGSSESHILLVDFACYVNVQLVLILYTYKTETRTKKKRRKWMKKPFISSNKTLFFNSYYCILLMHFYRSFFFSFSHWANCSVEILRGFFLSYNHFTIYKYNHLW